MSSTASNLLLAILLLAANAFYVAAEFALVKSRGFRIRAMVEQDRFGARLLQGMMGNIEAYLACCQLGITMASLGLGWVGEPTVSALLEPLLIPLGMSERTLHFVSFMAGFLVFSSLHIVIGEQVPKTLAIRQPMPVSQWIAYPLHLSYLVFYPLNWLLNSASRGILRLLGVKESSQHEILTDSEIEGLVEESAVHGGIESGEAEYIHNVFRFGDLAVSDVMVHRTAMVMINADLPPDELVREVLATEYTRIPLWRDKPENIIGVLHAKDLLRAIRASDGDTSRINVVGHHAAAVVRAGDAAFVRTVEGVPPPQDPLCARRRRIWRSRGHGDAGRHSGRNRRRYFRRARRRGGRRPRPARRLRRGGRLGADPRSQPRHELASAGRGGDDRRGPRDSRSALDPRARPEFYLPWLPLPRAAA